MTKSDCFLCKGTNECALYYIAGVLDGKAYAFSIYMGPQMIQGLEQPSEYDDSYPDDVIMMPSDTYTKGKQLMRRYVKEMHDVIAQEQLKAKEAPALNHSYTDGEHIYTMTDFDGKTWFYKLFRIEDENISPEWSGGSNAEGLDILTPLADATVEKAPGLYETLRQEMECLFAE